MTAESKTNNFNLIAILLSAVGVVLSVMLIQEFFGTAGAFVESLCSATGTAGGCMQVAASQYSAFRNVPLLGDVPVAFLGLTFYGFFAIVSYFAYSRQDEEKLDLVRLLFLLALFGLVVDLILFGISKFVIGVICPLCFATYIVTLLLLVVTFLQLKQATGENPFMQINTSVLKTISTNFLNFLIIFLALFACGIGIGKFSNTGTSIGRAGDETVINEKIAAYEKAPVLNINTTDAPFLGDAGAPITIVKYADFNCGHCMHTSHILRQILTEFPGMVKVNYKNFPLDGNCNRLVGRKSPDASSCIAASASICAKKQNKFKEMYIGLYDDNEKGMHHSAGSVLELANNAGLNMAQFQACMGSEETKNYINKEVDEGEKLNIQSTPSLFVNNKAIDPGTPNPDFLRALIKKLIGK